MDKQRYLDNPNFCPACESQAFDRTDEQYDSAHLWLYFRCAECEEMWTEEYKLVDVEMMGDSFTDCTHDWHYIDQTKSEAMKCAHCGAVQNS